MPLISLEKVNKIYNTTSGNENRVDALCNVNLTIEKGEFVAIVGSSGSGKSTLMNVLGCLDVPTSGKYLLDGKDVSKFNENELAKVRNLEIGFIFQSFHLIPSLTALENVELPLSYRGVKHSISRELAKEALSRVSLLTRASHLPNALSGGQQQRVAIARAICARPPIILADEPTGNLDTKVGAEVMAILTELNKEGKTIILITHDKAIAKMANRIITVSDGEIL